MAIVFEDNKSTTGVDETTGSVSFFGAVDSSVSAQKAAAVALAVAKAKAEKDKA
jgi:hypothetical protein